MTAAPSIIVAVILVACAWRATHRWEGGLVPGEHFLIFLLMTGMFQTGGFTLMGMNLSAWRLLVWIMLVGFVLATSRPALPRPTMTDLPIVFQGLLLLWCLYRLTAAPTMGYGVRNLLKIIYPFLVLLLARKVARPGHLGVYVVPMIGASLIISVFVSGISEQIPYVAYNPLLWGVFWPRATFADHAAILVGVILVVLWSYQGYVPARSRRVYMAGVLWLILSPLAVACRTGLLATAAALSGYALVRYRIKGLPIIGGLFVLGAAVFVFVPQVRDSTFYQADHVAVDDLVRGEIDMDNINSTGRFATWGELLHRFYRPHPLEGSGLGAVQGEMYSQAEAYGIKAAHSEYVTLLCDTGLVGLLLYAATVAASLGLAAKFLVAPATAELKAAAALVVTSFLATLSAAGFDNVFLYTLPVHSLPFAFTGILLGLSSNAPTTVLGNPWGWSRAYVWSQWRPTGSRPSPAVRAPQMFMTERHGV